MNAYWIFDAHDELKALYLYRCHHFENAHGWRVRIGDADAPMYRWIWLCNVCMQSWNLYNSLDRRIEKCHVPLPCMCVCANVPGCGSIYVSVCVVCRINKRFPTTWDWISNSTFAPFVQIWMNKRDDIYICSHKLHVCWKVFESIRNASW